MNRGEFLQGLQNALSGKVPPVVVRDNLNYYNDYIRGEVQKGRDERDVMEELGDPRLIARTIIDTTPDAGDGMYEEYRPFGSYVGGAGSTEWEKSESGAGASPEDVFGRQIHYFDLSKWYWKVLAVVIVILVMTVVITIVTGLLAFLIPLLPAIIVVCFIMWFIQRYGG
ncbi:MAG: DUF1700 domain-containing protein [Clostridiales bacterium]|nr:DUF1700 domain-containing protein [Clostridiales bacterium]